MAGISSPKTLQEGRSGIQTRIVPIDIETLGNFRFSNPNKSFLEGWDLDLSEVCRDTEHFLEAAKHLREKDIPVAFPTETVYGLGADATRSSAVRGIYDAKQRPVDNPLIVHICSLAQLRRLLKPELHRDRALSGSPFNGYLDPIPQIYHEPIRRFWPGPLTILLQNPINSNLAPEVTAGLPTFGARMPSSLLALALIKVADVPLAAPSANASTRPSPTTAQHVKTDLDGRIEIILDDGPCKVGVESTVVDGLSYPPSILRPGGVSIEQLREIKGWEKVVVGYQDGSQIGQAPKAPGMKYKHYSPKARVILAEPQVGNNKLDAEILMQYLKEGVRSVGMIRTRNWEALNLDKAPGDGLRLGLHSAQRGHSSQSSLDPLHRVSSSSTPSATHSSIQVSLSLSASDSTIAHVDIWDIGLGRSTADIARGIFSALRELDQKGVEVMFVEGIDDEGDAAAAVMNRLRKASEVEIRA